MKEKKEREWRNFNNISRKESRKKASIFMRIVKEKKMKRINKKNNMRNM